MSYSIQYYDNVLKETRTVWFAEKTNLVDVACICECMSSSVFMYTEITLLEIDHNNQQKIVHKYN